MWEFQYYSADGPTPVVICKLSLVCEDGSVETERIQKFLYQLDRVLLSVKSNNKITGLEFCLFLSHFILGIHFL